MLARLLRPIRNLVGALLASNAPNQLAAGFAVGMVLGLAPKGNLIALSLLVLLFSLRVNAGVGLLAALAFSWVGPALDPFTDKLGAYVLTVGSMQSTYAALFHLPLGPLFAFNNTVVVGSLLVGLWAFYPAYWLSLLAFRRLKPQTLAARHVEPHTHEENDRRAA
jgi:uncharacterized protein (TIGR03546 family)